VLLEHPIDVLTHAIQSSPKYRHVDSGLIRRVVARELGRRKNPQDALKAARSTLHQIAGAYFAGRIQYTQWEEELEKAPDAAAFRAVCRSLLERHASMRERLYGMENLHKWIFDGTGPISSILDIGCGFHPIALEWMPLASDVRYEAFDLYSDLVAFLNRYFVMTRRNATAYACDVTAHTPENRADLALIFKLLPLLDHLPDADPLEMLKRLNTRWLAVSFPVTSLGGKEKGMVGHYATRFSSLIADRPWTVTSHVFPSELIFLVDKGKEETTQSVGIETVLSSTQNSKSKIQNRLTAPPDV